jgi:hypothetical protein
MKMTKQKTPWAHPSFQWLKNTPTEQLTTYKKIGGFIQGQWKFGSLKGDGISWNQEQEFFIYQENTNPDFLEWPTSIRHLNDSSPLLWEEHGWKPVLSHETDWWYYQPKSHELKIGVKMRLIETALHIPNIDRFKESLYQYMRSHRVLPFKPNRRTIWHAIWDIWLVRTDNTDQERTEVFEATYQYILQNRARFNLDSLDYKGYSWFHLCAKYCQTQDAWEEMLDYAVNIWGVSPENYPKTLDTAQTAFELFAQRAKMNPWIQEWIEERPNFFL